MDASSLTSYSIRNAPSTGYRALLIGQWGSTEYEDKELQEESLRELFQLSETAGIKSLHELFVHIPMPDPRHFLKAGIIDQVRDLVKNSGINLLIVDVNLKPGQLRNLEEALKIRVIGRVELILDIFAMRAKTKASALQVELAQLTYILPRLKGLGGVLSRLGGGIGTRGPGETMLETDRRHIRKRIQKIKKELEKFSRHLGETRKNRSFSTFSLVGYTNAGKTSLLNRLSSSPKLLFAEDRLFATLDSFSRKVFLANKNHKPVYSIITDTIGFIQNLPANLVAAFRSTLDEIKYTDAIILVVDAASSRLEEEIRVVKEELGQLGAVDKPILLFFNKDDIVFKDDRRALEKKYPQAIWGNTMSKQGVAALRRALFNMVDQQETGGQLN